MTDQPKDALEDELSEVEADLADLRRGLDELHDQVGEQAHAPTTDVEERAQLLTAINEQETLLDRMERRRSDLLRRLGKE